MTFRDVMSQQPRPASVRGVDLPRREQYHPSPADWRDEVLYFLLPDRFSDAQEGGRPILDAPTLPLRGRPDSASTAGPSPLDRDGKAEPSPASCRC